MTQIWMTYDELGSLLRCDRDEARAYSAQSGLDRRRSRDGQTRVKLNSFLADMFFDAIVRERLDRQLSRCAEDLKAMHERMARPSATAALRPAANNG